MVALERLGIDSFNREIVNCLGEDIAAPAMLVSKSVGLRPPGTVPRARST